MLRFTELYFLQMSQIIAHPVHGRSTFHGCTQNIHPTKKIVTTCLVVPRVCGSTGGLGVGRGSGGPVKIPLEGPRLQQFPILLHSLKRLYRYEVIVNSLPLSILTAPGCACSHARYGYYIYTHVQASCTCTCYISDMHLVIFCCISMYTSTHVITQSLGRWCMSHIDTHTFTHPSPPHTHCTID